MINSKKISKKRIYKKSSNLKLINKQKYAQYYSTNIKELLNNCIELFIKDYNPNIPIIEPCCGQGHIIEYLKLKGLNYFELYDIEPKYENTIEQDTIINPPDYNNKYIITNPPYGLYRTLKKEQKELYKEQFKDRRIIDNIFKIYIKQIIYANVIAGILIIPINFLLSKNKKLKQLFLKKYQLIYANLFQKQTFKDARIEICTFYFKRRENLQNNKYYFPASLITKNNNIKFIMELSERNNYFYGNDIFKKIYEIKDKKIKEQIFGIKIDYKILIKKSEENEKENEKEKEKENEKENDKEKEFIQNNYQYNKNNEINQSLTNNSYKTITKYYNKQLSLFKDNKILSTYRKSMNIFKYDNRCINNLLLFLNRKIFNNQKKYMYLTNIKIFLYEPLIKAVYSTDLNQDINPKNKIDTYHSYINIVSVIRLTENEQKYIIKKFNECYNIYKKRFYSLFMQPVNHEYNMKCLQKNIIKIWLNNIIYEMINKRIINSVNNLNTTIYDNLTIFKSIIILILLIIMLIYLLFKN